MYVHNETLFIAGTSSLRDVVDDLLLPTAGVRHTARYKAVVRKMRQHPGIERVVGHSLGAAVAKQIAEDYGLRYELFANPGFNPFGGVNIHHHAMRGDPIAAFDNANRVQLSAANPHSYNYAPTMAGAASSSERWA